MPVSSPTRNVASETPAPRLSTLSQIQIASLWFALFTQWMTVVPVLVPAQVAEMLGSDAALKEGVAGSVIASGAFIAMVMAPLAGALSDRSSAKRGRRRPYLITGVFGISVALVWLGSFNGAGSVWLYTLAFLHLQFWWNWAAGPYAGLVPDVVPKHEANRASAWLNVMSVLGTIIGNVLLVALYSARHLYPTIAVFIAIMLLCLWLTLRGAREPTPSPPRERFELVAFIRSFYLDPRLHRNFYWVLVTRLFSNMGIWSIFTFMLYYLQDVIGIRHPTNILNGMLGAGVVLAIPASLLGARLADHLGVVTVVRLTSWILAAAAIGFVLLALHPNLLLVLAVGLVFCAAYGTYQAVDWALALQVLPDDASSGKDMGIWQVSMVLPQILGPAATGWMLSWVKAYAGAGPAYVVAFVVAAGWFVLAALLVSRIRIGSRQHVSTGLAKES
ncbi:MFS transporter [Paraburkholderia sp. UYCP14C]|uniref:MFS transporter n=1 Tax=Paraburkholderia sp. UYCP14C TaxID=2511130 RepID=UPI00101F9067|nr:MFS transporter [Paraburkholderia sp. UYCP14C]RZF29170.1 MFS transporter [Paraburkholderia sp. UYCP14C]